MEKFVYDLDLLSHWMWTVWTCLLSETLVPNKLMLIHSIIWWFFRLFWQIYQNSVHLVIEWTSKVYSLIWRVFYTLQNGNRKKMVTILIKMEHFSYQTQYPNRQQQLKWAIGCYWKHVWSEQTNNEQHKWFIMWALTKDDDAFTDFN